MKKFAVIDIGSNSVRLMFVADGKVLYKSLHTTRLGEGIATACTLTEAAIERSARAVACFYQQALNEGAQEVFAFATAAVRSAKNGGEFVARVRELCPLDVEVIAGETEAEIGILGALGKQDGAVIDVGGASTELVIKRGGVLTYKKSMDIGVVRLKDKCGREKSLLCRAAEEAAKGYGDKNALLGEDLSTVYAIGGTATTIASLLLGLQTYSSEKVTGTEITAAQMQAMAEKLLAMTVEEIAALPCMPAGRADVLAGGAVLLAVLMDKLGINKLIVSDRDNLEGYAIKKGLMQ